MELDADVCYRAVTSRDPRFDGRFFTGVESTGIYCRPVCPARTPRRDNVRFFACAAAAAEAGFRPCKRCRPETSPGTPAWMGSSATVSRALRLISEGFLDSAGVDELAGVLGVGARHLRRLFDEHLGASPRSVALTRRVHFARALLDQTPLPITEIAFSAGFSSVRRFNDAFRKVFETSPSRVRTGVGAGGAPVTLRLRLPFRPPLDWEALIEFHRARAIPGVEAVATTYRRSVEVDGTAGEIEVHPPGEGNYVHLVVSAGLSRSLSRVVERVRRVFDLDADPSGIAAHLERDRGLAALVRRRPGLRVPGAWDGFEVAVRAIVGQQVSVAGAATILGRIVERYGRAVELGNGVTRLFPTPERLARARLSRAGVTPGRERAICALARAVCDGDVDLRRPAALGDTVDRLTSIEGIGAWTAHYVAMRGCGDPDAFPAGDMHLMRAANAALGARTEAALVERAAAWRPWRAYAAIHLWETQRKRGRR
jgi:AraC family transcriptional regulator of adaptative response / DNA-3-methyladenine glycosylase II